MCVGARYHLAGDALSVTMQNALLGVGDSRRVAAVSIGTQWFLFLPMVNPIP
jgi:MATE family multidrug resistance protein